MPMPFIAAPKSTAISQTQYSLDYYLMPLAKRIDHNVKNDGLDAGGAYYRSRRPTSRNHYGSNNGR